ncbi:MAG: S8 family serine peptidase [Vicinamibacterales bacterium]
MKKLQAAATAAALLLALAVVRGQQPVGETADAIPGEVLVKYRAGVSVSRRNDILTGRASAAIGRFLDLDIDHVRLPRAANLQAMLAAFRAMPEVESAQPNYRRQVVQAPNDPYWLNGSMWGLERIQAQDAWASYGTGSPTIVVADLDTGVNYNHPDLAANLWRNPGEVPGNGVDDDHNGYVDDVYGIDVANRDGDPMDDHGHGTHTFGTIAAVGNNGEGVVGVSWNTKVLSCKFIDASGNGYDSGIVECFNYLVALKNRGVDIRASSNSYGGPRSGGVPTVLQSAIDRAGNAGILNVFAAGNSGVNIDSAPFDPASLTSASIVSVAASDTSDSRASFSNFGFTSVDLGAPGVSIVSTYGSGYASSAGTSMATPLVAGAAALLTSYNKGLTVAALKAALLSSVDVLPQWSGLVASGGRLNVFRAAASIAGPTAPAVSVTGPAAGTAFTAPATIALSATATDADGIAQVTFYANGTPLGTDTSSPYSFTWSNVGVGTYAITASATDTTGATGTSQPVSIVVGSTAPPPSGRVNVAAAANGASAIGSSTYNSGYAASGAINGDRRGQNWGAGGGWNDATPDSWPDWLEVDFNGAQTIGEIDVFSVQDAYGSPADPTASMTFTQYGLTAFSLEYWTGTQWLPIPGGTVSGNSQVWRIVTFAPLTTAKIRVWVNVAATTFSRVAEVEAYAAPPPSGRVNVAAAANGASAIGSSTYNSGYAASGAINGDRRGQNWGAGGGWNDGTPDAWPDWLEVDFNGAQTIGEIDVFSVQDNYAAPGEPTTSMTFSLYGLSNFSVEYWTGTQWVSVPGGIVTGNTSVWRQVTFPDLTTSRIRVWVSAAGRTWSRIAEVEAYTP